MPRRREVPKRDVLPDPKFGNQDVSKFINVIMQSGKKAVAERIVTVPLITSPPSRARILSRSLAALVTCEARGRGQEPPCRRCQLSGAGRSPSSRRMALSMRWLREAARKRSEKSMAQRLGGELLEAAEGRGSAMKKREEVHRMAEANKAFSHYRF